MINIEKIINSATNIIYLNKTFQKKMFFEIANLNNKRNIS